MPAHYLHLPIIFLHLLALACTFVCTSYTLSTLTCTRLHFVCTYLHSLSFYLHLLALADTLLTGINTHVFYTNTCKDISIIMLRPCLVARSLMIVGVACIGRQACRLLQLKFLSPVTGQLRCYFHLAAHTTVWAKHSFLVLRQVAEQLKASHSVSV